MIFHGDCLEKLKELADNSVDSVVTDPPYGWRFMGKAWDGADIEKVAKNKERGGVMADGRERKPRDLPAESAGTYDLSLTANQSFQKFTEMYCRELMRVLKPGGHLLIFCGPRTYHRMASGVEDAGFEIRDQLQWLFGSGFPKSHDISKGIDKAAGITQWKETTSNPAARPGNGLGATTSTGWAKPQRPPKPVVETDAAKQWQGWGTALKPSNEPVVLARKPLTGAYLLASLALECQSKLFAEIVSRYSQSNLSEKTQQSIAQWLAGKNTLTPDASLEVTAMLQSKSTDNSYLSTELSWLRTLDGIWTHANTCTIEMASSLTTDLKILKSLLSNNMQASTTQVDGPGVPLSASLVANLLNALELKLNFIHISFAQESAIAEGDHSKSLLDERVNNEPIVLARKPLSESTVAKNVLRWGVGGLNIDASRIGEGGHHAGKTAAGNSSSYDLGKEYVHQPNQIYTQGRWPANLLLDEIAAAMLDEQSGTSSARGGNSKKQSAIGFSDESGRNENAKVVLNDSGGASRFFYCAKASKSERNAGLEGMPEKDRPLAISQWSGQTNGSGEVMGPSKPQQNSHPTVKPLKLMEYLIRLITPPSGIVLDPFAGSGSTLVAAKRLGFEFIGIEMNEEYIQIIERRVASAKQNPA